MPAISASCATLVRGELGCMPAHLLTKPVDDLGRLRSDVRRLDTPRTIKRDRELVDDPPGTARQEQHAIAQPDGFANVVCHEHDRHAGLVPYALELVVHQVACDRIE